MGFLDRLQHGWNAFINNRDPTVSTSIGPGFSMRPDRPRLTRGNERSIVTAVCNRIAMDVAAVDFRHCKVDENGQFEKELKSALNDCLKVEANLDQTGRAFIQDVVLSMLDEGVVAIVPTETTLNPKHTKSYDINSMRTGKIVEWYPEHVKVRLYDQRTSKKEEITLPKSMVCIVENPLYPVMNEPNSTMQRLMRKLSLLDISDEQIASGKLDMIIQLPYIIKTEARRQQAETRRKDIEMQLMNSKYGIAYTDGTEKITQLNRTLENNLLKQVEFLTDQFYAQLGFSKEILDGTADEQKQLNYFNRTIEPIIAAIANEMTRKFLSKTARTQRQTISYFRDPFKLVPINNIADIADRFTRNEILSSNEIRAIIGLKPSDDPKADELRNSNMPQPDEGQQPMVGEEQMNPEMQGEETPEQQGQQVQEPQGNRMSQYANMTIAQLRGGQ